MALITNQGGGNMNKFKLFPKATWPNIYASFWVGGGAPGEREIMVHRLGENIKNFFLCCDFRSDGLESEKFSAIKLPLPPTVPMLTIKPGPKKSCYVIYQNDFLSLLFTEKGAFSFTSRRVSDGSFLFIGTFKESD